jgi:transcriptional regulator with XRE-family HTH domain
MGFGKTLQDLRKAAGLSQAELAVRSDTSIDSLRNWEQDKALPKIDAVTRLASALSVSLDRFAYSGEPEAAPKKPRQGQPPRSK